MILFGTKMSDTTAYIQRLLQSNPLREPLLSEIIQELNLPNGSSGLDAGCGIGLQAMLLLEAIGTRGHVTGLDILPDLLAYGSKLVEESGLADWITFREGNINCLPFADDTFDWVWSADCIGYPAGELQPVLQELIRVIRPGGSIFLLGWSSQQLLPGYPLLEARLNGTCSGYLPFLRDKSPESNFMCALHAFHDAGLQNIKAQTYVCNIQAPWKDDMRTALTSLFDMLWGTPQPDVSPQDWAEYQRLCNPESVDFILNVPAYYAFYTCTLFQGTVA
jgi:demethylmenaquinone methyltransferase/2-methoxy-6-polyprenyl-1,4-benzoquinol methylase